MSSVRVALVTGGVPHYRWPFFAALAERGVELHVITAGRLPAGMLASHSPDPRVRLTHLEQRSPRWRGDVIEALAGAAPDVVLLEHGSALDYTWTVLLSRTIRAPRVLWTHGIARQELYGRRRGPGAWGRWAQIDLADAVLCYDGAGARLVRRARPRKRVSYAPNSSDGHALRAHLDGLRAVGRDEIRRRLGLRPHARIICGLGRLVAEKEFSRLVTVLALVRKSGLDAQLALIGEGPERANIARVAAETGTSDDVVFAGGVREASDLAAWLLASDVSVSPAAIGLSAVDALFAGVPTITPMPRIGGPWHGPEYRYLRRDETAFMTDENSDHALAAACVRYLERSDAERAATSEACSGFAFQQLGVDRMATRVRSFIEVVRQCASAR